MTVSSRVAASSRLELAQSGGSAPRKMDLHNRVNFRKSFELIIERLDNEALQTEEPYGQLQQFSVLSPLGSVFAICESFSRQR